jgi:hypothetical protein
LGEDLFYALHPSIFSSDWMQRGPVAARLRGRSEREFMLTSQFICTRKGILDGRRFRVWLPGTVPCGVPVLSRLRRGVVASGTG